MVVLKVLFYLELVRFLKYSKPLGMSCEQTAFWFFPLRMFFAFHLYEVRQFNFRYLICLCILVVYNTYNTHVYKSKILQQPVIGHV